MIIEIGRRRVKIVKNDKKEVFYLADHYSDLDQHDQWTLTMFLYRSALSKIKTKIRILTDEFTNIQRNNPIEHVNSRIK